MVSGLQHMENLLYKCDRKKKTSGATYREMLKENRTNTQNSVPFCKKLQGVKNLTLSVVL